MSTICEVSENAPSACLFSENPYRLMTLWDLLPLYADTFVRLIDDLKQAELELSGAVQVYEPEEIYLERLRLIGRSLINLRKHCDYLRLRSAEKQAKNITTFLSEKPEDVTEVWRMLKEFRTRIQEDLEETVTYALTPSRVDLFYEKAISGELKGRLVRRSPEILWGHEVCSNFRSAVRDISDANECLSFEKGTACVFHLMRVVETGLRALAKSLNDPRLNPKLNPSWENILSKCDEELEKSYAQRSQEWKQNATFYSEATATLRALKDAWRNPTMHVEKDYDYEDALHIWRTTRAFMRHLATRLGE